MAATADMIMRLLFNMASFISDYNNRPYHRIINVTFILIISTLLLQSPSISSFTTYTTTSYHRLPFPSSSHVKPHHHHRYDNNNNHHHHHQSLSLTASNIQSPSETSSNNDDNDYRIYTIFDFTNDNTTGKVAAAVDAFERIDDAIMGGISTSTLRDVVGQPYASWSGVCRIDGGGFCGIRTRPFATPLPLPSTTTTTTGIFLDVRFASDDEPHRRVWKVTLRTDPQSRGEQLYQAQYTLSPEEGWQRVYVPFDSFRLVRGARLVKANAEDDDGQLTVLSAESLAKSGITQLGLSLSQFVMAESMTTLENFRPGYFELQVKTMGFYGTTTTTEPTTTQESSPNVLSPKESQRRQPFLLKLLSPMGGFLERRSRRRRAMTLLVTKRGMTRRDAALWGIKMNRNAGGGGVGASMAAVGRWLGLVISDVVGWGVTKVLRIGLIYPLIVVTRSVALGKRILSRKKGGMGEGLTE